jgi:hypothetical protein
VPFKLLEEFVAKQRKDEETHLAVPKEVNISYSHVFFRFFSLVKSQKGKF